jgi:hypothetical protein
MQKNEYNFKALSKNIFNLSDISSFIYEVGIFVESRTIKKSFTLKHSTNKQNILLHTIYGYNKLK